MQERNREMLVTERDKKQMLRSEVEYLEYRTDGKVNQVKLIYSEEEDTKHNTQTLEKVQKRIKEIYLSFRHYTYTYKLYISANH